ncbi:MAG: hypothetical protein EOO24_16460 [Comamonadaceae bacterium]|nr:MAG: hypothetical protein EOO24_16460 [Comamonadaceae bacterium]
MRTISIAVNDYGFELLCATDVDWPGLLASLLRVGHDAQAQDAMAGADVEEGERIALLHEVLESLNASELAQRRFREIARVSGLISQGFPGEKRSNKQLQASSVLFWEVFRKYDPANKLLRQAEQELLAQELEIGRLRASLTRMNGQRLAIRATARPTPFAFPLMVERFREKLSNESVADRIARMVEQLEKAAGGAVQVGQVDGAAEVARGLAFGQEDSGERARAPVDGEEGGADGSTAGGRARRPRRERKPSRPLPPL